MMILKLYAGGIGVLKSCFATTIILIGLISGNVVLAEDFNIGLELDETPPELINYTADTGETGDSFIFSFNITDMDNGSGEGSGIFSASIYYWFDGGTPSTISLANTYGDYWNQTITLNGTAHNMTYYLEVYDNALNSNTTTNSTVTLSDDDPPEFADVRATPYVAIPNSIINITATITDNWEVDTATLYIMTLGTTHTMSHSGSNYYFSQAYSLSGTYQYYITANDTAGNSNTSETGTFEISSSEATTGFGNFFQLYTPADIYTRSNGVLLLKVLNKTTGVALSGQADNISCYIKYPDGTFFMNGPHPYEDIPGIYLVNFTTEMTTGIYHCWATINYSDGNQYLDAGLMHVKWDVYDNVSRLYERISGIIFLGHWERYNMTEQMAYHLGLHTVLLRNLSRQTEESSFMDRLQETALGEAISILFWSIILAVIAILGTLFATRRRKITHPGKIPVKIAESIQSYTMDEANK